MPGTIHITKLSAKWCVPCQRYDPILDEVVGARDDVSLSRVDIEEQPEVAAKYGVTGIPYTIFSDNSGEVLGSTQGALTAKQLNRVLDGLFENWPQE